MLHPLHPHQSSAVHLELGRISHRVLEQRGRDVLAALRRYGVTPNGGNRLEQSVNVLASIPGDREFPAFIANPLHREHTAEAMSAIFQAVAVIEAMRQSPSHRPLFTHGRLKKLVKGAFPARYAPGDLPENRRFETYIGALLVLCGCSVTDDEPDWRIGYLGGETIGVAVKRINSPNPDAVASLVRDASDQMQAHRVRGFVVLGVDSLTGALPTTVPAAEFFTLFNERVHAIHRQLDSMEKDSHLLGAMLIGSPFQWVPIVGGDGFSLFTATVHQMLTFADAESPERLAQFFDRTLVPKLRNAVRCISDLSGPAWLKAG